MLVLVIMIRDGGRRQRERRIGVLEKVFFICN